MTCRRGAQGPGLVGIGRGRKFFFNELGQAPLVAPYRSSLTKSSTSSIEHNNQTKGGRDKEKVSSSRLLFVQHFPLLIVVLLLSLVTALDGFDDDKVDDY